MYVTIALLLLSIELHVYLIRLRTRRLSHRPTLRKVNHNTRNSVSLSALYLQLVKLLLLVRIHGPINKQMRANLPYGVEYYVRKGNGTRLVQGDRRRGHTCRRQARERWSQFAAHLRT